MTQAEKPFAEQKAAGRLREALPVVAIGMEVDQKLAIDINYASERIKELLLTMVGEDEEYYDGSARANDINNRVIHGRNRLRKELRDKINEL